MVIGTRIYDVPCIYIFFLPFKNRDLKFRTLIYNIVFCIGLFPDRSSLVTLYQRPWRWRCSEWDRDPWLFVWPGPARTKQFTLVVFVPTPPSVLCGLTPLRRMVRRTISSSSMNRRRRPSVNGRVYNYYYTYQKKNFKCLTVQIHRQVTSTTKDKKEKISIKFL